jgi:hypothetical protein
VTITITQARVASRVPCRKAVQLYRQARRQLFAQRAFLNRSRRIAERPQHHLVNHVMGRVDIAAPGLRLTPQPVAQFQYFQHAHSTSSRAGRGSNRLSFPDYLIFLQEKVVDSHQVFRLYTDLFVFICRLGWFFLEKTFIFAARIPLNARFHGFPGKPRAQDRITMTIAHLRRTGARFVSPTTAMTLGLAVIPAILIAILLANAVFALGPVR